MPELPEVETTKRGIEPHITGLQVAEVVVRQPSLRWPVPANLPQLLKNQSLHSICRRGKYLLLRFPLGHLLIHLGMSGSLRIAQLSEDPGYHDHVDIVFADSVVLRFNDPRRFGCILWTEEPVQQHKLISSLGPEPLGEQFTGEYLYSRSRRRKQAVKTFIMDSHLVVGVGNIYANESLFMAGIRPTRSAGAISKARYERLVEFIKMVLERSITQGGTTLRDFVGGDGKPGYFQQQLQVYGRENQPCRVCQTKLKQVRIAQRSTVYCPSCQT